MKFSVNVTAIAMVLAVLAACAPEAKEDPAVNAMRAAAESESQMLTAVSAWLEAWDSGNTDKLGEIALADYKRIAPDQNVDNLDELRVFIGQVHAAYPDYRLTNDGAAAGPDGAFVQWTVTGTDTGSENSTGNSLTVTGFSRYTFVDGKIASELVVFDTGSVLAQLATEEMPHMTE